MRIKPIFVITISALALFLNQNLYSQTKSGYKIAFKDYHSSDITDIKLSQNKKYILTSDEDGKVLMFDSKTFDFLRTIKPVGRIPVSGIQALRNDSLLLMSQKYSFSYLAEQDSLILQNIYSDENIYKSQASFDLVSIDSDTNYGILFNENSHYSFNAIDENFEVKISVNIPGFPRPKIITASHNLEEISYITPMETPKQIKVLSTATHDFIRKINIPEKEEVISLFYKKSTPELCAITVNENEQKVKIFNLDSYAFDSPAYTIDYYATPHDKVVSQYDGEQHIMTIVNGSFPMKPLVIIRNNNDFSHQIVELPSGVNHAAINPERKEIIYVNQAQLKNIKDFSVYNYQSKNITGTFPEMTTNFYKTVFLPDNSWVAYTESYGKDILHENIKYFEAGTFNNRFRMLNFKDYLEIKHGLMAYGANLIANRGIAVIYGNDERVTENAVYFIYDFKKDSIEQITKTKPNFTAFQDYNFEKNSLLVANGYFYNQGHTESINLELIIDNKIIPVEGDYKFGKFSENGNYLLTVNKLNSLEIRTVPEMKTVFSKTLLEGNYYINSFEETGFSLSNSYRIRDMNECNQETDLFELENDQYKVTNIPCTVISSMDYRNHTAGFIIDNFGIGIRDKTLPFSASEFPQTLSFNKDASQFILSLSNGKNVIYDTETLQPVGYMIHPDEKTHVFYDVHNHYFSNIHPKQFLMASKDGKNIPLAQVENELFNPEKILELFGTPNPDYLAALQKAIQLRKENTNIDEEVDYKKTVILSDAIPAENTKKPNLYLLSIGVADYEDDSYDLTFSDKDAIDMAKIYGKLDAQQIKKYNDKFFGTRYTLYNQRNEPLETINNYAGMYIGTGIKYLINSGGDIWLNDENGKFTIWDYKNKRIDSVSLPEIENWGSISDLDDKIFIKPDNSGFYLKGKDGFFEYLFNTKKFTAVSFPFEPNKENFAPLNDDKWLHFNSDENTLTINIGTKNSTSTDQTFVIAPFDDYSTKIKSIKTDGSTVTDSVWLGGISLKTVSSDGKYVFFQGMGDIYYLDLNQKEIIPTRLPVHLENQFNGEISVNAKEKQFYVYEKLYDSNQIKITYYDFNGKKIDTLAFEINMTKTGIVNDGKSYYFIRDEGSLLSKNMFNNTDETLENVAPYTFEQVYLEYVINEQANSKEIKKKLQEFFSKASPNDQIMVFLAGHGVLDSDNNYYFAPYDMDFQNVNKNGVSFETIVKELQKSPARNKLLLMDTCHSGKTIDLESDSENRDATMEHNQGDRGARVNSSKPPKYKVSEIISTLFEDFFSNSGITIISASSGGDLAQEHNDWGNGAFTSSYIKTLKSKMAGTLSTIILQEEDTQIPIPLNDEFIDDLYKEVIKLTEGKQIPDIREVNKNATIQLW